MTGCGGDAQPVGSVGYVKGFAGAVAADEPQAVVVARDVLSAGGTAADAAVSLYFSLAVTLPSTASLGGGGACVVYDGASRKTEVLDFSAPAVAAPAGLAMAVPANPRGFFALHAKYGHLRWESLLVRPERMAREGVPVSRALARDLALAGPHLADDPVARHLFFRPDGRGLAEGDQMINYDLAATIADLRRAPGEFYAGESGRRLARSAQAMGAGLAIDDLRDLHPRFEPGETIPIDYDVAVMPRLRLGTVSAAGPTSLREMAGLPAAPVGSPDYGTGFVVLDSYGNAVSCAVSANGLFGSGHFIPGAGFAAAAPPRPGRNPAVPALLVNNNSGEIHLIAAVGGGTDAPAALAETILNATDSDRDAARAIEAAKRAGGASSHINAVACRGGQPSFDRCSVATDPQGSGYGVMTGRN